MKPEYSAKNDDLEAWALLVCYIEAVNRCVETSSENNDTRPD